MNDKVNILLIEDNPADSELLNIYLKSAYPGKFTLVIADSLSKGLELLGDSPVITSMEGQQPDVIILDLSLPDSRGLDTFNSLHAKASGIPIIVLTGMEDESIGIEAVKMGAQDFLIKGQAGAKELKRSLNYSIERYKLMQALSSKARELEEKTDDLQKEKQKLALAHKIAKIGSWEWDLVTGKAYWSDELFELHGIESSNGYFSFRDLLSHIHPDDRDNIWNVIIKSTQTNNPVNFYYRVIQDNGSIRTFYSIGEVIKNEDGKAVKVVGIRQDVTERLQEEEMQKLAMAATKSYNSVIITNKNGSIEWANEGFTQLTGYTLDEVKNTHGEILRRGEQTGISKNTEYYNKVIQTKAPLAYENKNYSKDGREYWTITTLTPVLDNKGTVGRILAIDSDITPRKAMEEDLRKANKIADELLDKANKALNDLQMAKKELEETMQVKEQFLANMSHEIRTPMNAIVGFTRLLLKTNPSPEQKQYLEIIKTSGGNLLVIVNDILDFSKLSSGKITFEQIEFSLLETISSLTELLLPKAREKNLKLLTEIDNRVNDNIAGDPTRLSQILMNLISNAIKFTPKGEIKITVKQIREDAQSAELMFSISDTGIGIPEGKLPKIFESFTQASSETTRKYGGTGLGLAIVKQLVELQGGAISVKSELNKGTIFSFTLSFKKGKGEVKKGRDAGKELTKLMPAEGLKILLVEDNLLNATLAEKVLNDWNWSVDVADNGFTALEKVQKNDFDVVLMDIQLPDIDGYEATRRIRTEMPPPKKNVAIIAMTAHALAGEDEKCYKAGMDGYISKPFEPENLYLKILTTLHINARLGNNLPQQEQYPELKNETIYIKSPSRQGRHTDLTYLKGLARGSNDFIIQMLNIFIEQTPGALERMEKAVDDKDWKTLRQIVHKMKPSIMFTGISEIINDVPLLEDYAAEESHLGTIPLLTDKIIKACNEAITELKEELEKLK